jgi:uncharacterized protein YndB with AHSA1/START domain
MRFIAANDIARPIAAVHAALSDTRRFEGMAGERNVRFVRRGDGGVGTEWDLTFRLRGRERQVTARLAESVTPSRILVTWTGRLTDGALALDLVALARGRTRLNVTLDILPKTLPARLFFQSLRLIKPRLNRRFRRRVARIVAVLEGRAPPA